MLASESAQPYYADTVALVVTDPHAGQKFKVDGAPRDWNEHSWPQHIVLSSLSGLTFPSRRNDPPHLLPQTAQTPLEAHWQNLTGLAPQESRFSVIIPIHADAQLIPHVLHALNRSNVPPSANMQIIIVSNACTDSSRKAVEASLRRLGMLEHIRAPALADSGLDRRALRARSNNIEILHIHTETPGKFNALNLGNEIARRRGNKIAIGLDADTFVEPDSLPVLFGDCVRNRLGEAGVGVVGISTTLKGRFHTSPNCSLVHLLSKEVTLSQEAASREIPGFFCAWDVNWLCRQGGFPESIIEDYALAVLIHLCGKDVVRSSAAAWTFVPASLADCISQRTRCAIGKLQVRDLFSYDLERVDEFMGAHPALSPLFSHRLRYLLNKIRPDNLAVFPRVALAFVFHELIALKAKFEYRANPAEVVWQTCQSTKGLGDAKIAPAAEGYH